jgi:hypothetical protein
VKVTGITRVVNGVAYLQPDLTAPKSPWLRASQWRATEYFPVPRTALQPGESLSALDLWVDASGVVHQMRLELKSSDSATTMTVVFSEFGQPETITAPAHWIRSGV